MLQRVAVIEGDDASPEAVRPTVALIDALGLEPGIEWVYPPVGSVGRERHGSIFPDEAREQIDACETTLFGSTSGLSALALLHLRWGRETYANVRPARWWPGCRSPLARPEGIDFVVVRENLEDLYLGCEGEVEALAPLGLWSTTARKPVAELGPGCFARQPSGWRQNIPTSSSSASSWTTSRAAWWPSPTSSTWWCCPTSTETCCRISPLA